MAIPKPMLVELSFRAKTYDIDYAGIVHNSGYFMDLERYRPIRIPEVMRAQWEQDGG